MIKFVGLGLDGSRMIINLWDSKMSYRFFV